MIWREPSPASSQPLEWRNLARAHPLLARPASAKSPSTTAAAVRNGVVLLDYVNGWLYRSTDKGETWTEISAGRPTDLSRLVVSPQWLYAVTNDGLVYA